MADELAEPFSASLYPTQIRYIKAIAARQYRYVTSAALQAIVDEHRDLHPEIKLEDGDWTHRREDR